jgi:hypothetical protein
MAASYQHGSPYPGAEVVHQLLDASEAAGALFPPGPRPGLTAARPCRPADAEVLTASDEVWSSIGRSLLVLAEQRNG